MSEIEGLRVARVSDWLCANVDSAVAPFKFDLIAGGHSNLTFKVTAANGSRFVLRRPPMGKVLASAHDMAREFRVISQLRDSVVPVAPALAFCADQSVTDAEFYVMKFVDGHVLRDRAAAEAVFDEASRRGVSESLVDTLAAIHAVDLTAVGLSELARHGGYIERQLKRWYGQYLQQRTRDLPAIERVHDELTKRIPPQTSTTLVHGDYRLDNCLVDDRGRVVAVLDWEICTLGDPLADVGMLHVYWSDPADDTSAFTGSATSAAGFLNRAEIAARYTTTSQRDLSTLPFYISFAYWKLACILEGVYARYLAGALGERSARELQPLAIQIDSVAAAAAEALEGLR